MKYAVNPEWRVDPARTGFNISAENVLWALTYTNSVMAESGSQLLSRLLQPTLTMCVGDVFQSHLRDWTATAINPYRNGQPDILAIEALQYLNKKERAHDRGLELKTSGGSIDEAGLIWKYGEPRINHLSAVSVASGGKICVTPTMLVVWDFIDGLPTVTGVFCSQLEMSDWSSVKAQGKSHGGLLRKSGLRRLANDWVVLTEDSHYQQTYMRLMSAEQGLLF